MLGSIEVSGPVWIPLETKIIYVDYGRQELPHGKYGKISVILITGGFGYLGGRLAKRLGNFGKEKVVLGTREISPKIPIELIGCETVQMELDDRKQLI